MIYNAKSLSWFLLSKRRFINTIEQRKALDTCMQKLPEIRDTAFANFLNLNKIYNIFSIKWILKYNKEESSYELVILIKMKMKMRFHFCFQFLPKICLLANISFRRKENGIFDQEFICLLKFLILFHHLKMISCLIIILNFTIFIYQLSYYHSPNTRVQFITNEYMA